MQIIRTIIWVLLLIALLLFSVSNAVYGPGDRLSTIAASSVLSGANPAALINPA